MMIQELVTEQSYNFHMRWLVRRDMAQVNTISQYTGGMKEEQRIATLRQNNCIGMIIEDTDSGLVVGHIIYLLHKSSITALEMKIHPEWSDASDRRECSIYRAIWERMMNKLSYARRSQINFLLTDNQHDWHTLGRLMNFGAIAEKNDNGWLARFSLND